MSTDTDAPERIWTWRTNSRHWSPHPLTFETVEYIRADVLEARIKKIVLLTIAALFIFAWVWLFSLPLWAE